MQQIEILRDSIVLYFPLEYRSAIAKVEDTFSQLFNGFTTTEATGAWRDPYGVIVKERLALVESFTEDLTAKQLAFIRKFAAGLGYICDQYCVSLRVNGRLEIIPSKEISQDPEFYYQEIALENLTVSATTVQGGLNA